MECVGIFPRGGKEKEKEKVCGVSITGTGHSCPNEFVGRFLMDLALVGSRVSYDLKTQFVLVLMTSLQVLRLKNCSYLS